MSTSKLITVGLAAVIAVASGGWIKQHNQLVEQAEQLAARSYQLEVQKQQLQALSERLQAQTDRLSAANVSMRRAVRLASQPELPDVVVSAPRLPGQTK